MSDQAAAADRFREPPPDAVTPPNYVDLHCHTDRSDGVMAPVQLYAAMRDCGIRLAAISDHDTLAGYRELAAKGLAAVADSTGPRLIPAVEINSVADRELMAMGVHLEEGELHMLAFGVDPDDATFERSLAEQRDGRRRRI